jgi:hypothetical protein
VSCGSANFQRQVQSSVEPHNGACLFLPWRDGSRMLPRAKYPLCGPQARAAQLPRLGFSALEATSCDAGHFLRRRSSSTFLSIGGRRKSPDSPPRPVRPCGSGRPPAGAILLRNESRRACGTLAVPPCRRPAHPTLPQANGRCLTWHRQGITEAARMTRLSSRPDLPLFGQQEIPGAHRYKLVCNRRAVRRGRQWPSGGLQYLFHGYRK